jgi:hypothetical protein
MRSPVAAEVERLERLLDVAARRERDLRARLAAVQKRAARCEAADRHLAGWKAKTAARDATIVRYVALMQRAVAALPDGHAVAEEIRREFNVIDAGAGSRGGA